MAKIKLIVSDFDGCLAELKLVHFNALNNALKTVGDQYIITEEEHITIFDGLSTRQKLEKLYIEKQFPKDKIDEVFNLKQELTNQELNNTLKYNIYLVNTFSKLKDEGYIIYVASNAIRKTIENGLKIIGIYDLIDQIFSNEDVENTKPHSEIYLKCMIAAGVNPDETLIIEDSPNGKIAAVKSGAIVCDVDSIFDTNYENILATIKRASTRLTPKFAAKNKLNVLIPMSGGGSRFKQAGYELPKPLINVGGKPMIQWVVENLNVDADFTFIVQKEHYDTHNLHTILNLIAPNCKIVIANGLTEGAACSALLAKEHIDNEKHLLIVNSDQFIEDFSIANFIYSAVSKKADASILTFEKNNDTKWSYAQVENGFVIHVAEKKPISNLATVGAYYWNKGSDFVKYAEKMIEENDRTNNEFYVVPSFNWMIRDDKKIITHSIETNKFWGLGTPEDLSYFLESFLNK